MDDEFKKIISRADQIVSFELTKKERFQTLTALREEDGRLKIGIQNLRRDAKELRANLDSAHCLRNEYEEYFTIITIYSGTEQQEVLKDHIADYNWATYANIQDQYYALTKDIPLEQMENEYQAIVERYQRYELRRRELVERSLRILSEIDRSLKNLSG
ncbi:MAG: hypothetical protein ACXAE3_13525 [Candidatus Kariarchaeaceae archaeon]